MSQRQFQFIQMSVSKAKLLDYFVTNCHDDCLECFHGSATWEFNQQVIAAVARLIEPSRTAAFVPVPKTIMRLRLPIAKVLPHRWAWMHGLPLHPLL